MKIGLKLWKTEQEKTVKTVKDCENGNGEKQKIQGKKGTLVKSGGKKNPPP